MSSSNRLTNSYFFYGTHPVRVNHGNGRNITSSTHHLSLYNPSTTIAEKATTKSLDDLRNNHCSTEEEDEVFEDAMDKFNDEHEHSDHRHSSDEQTLNLTEALIECQEITHLFLTNHLDESLRRTKAQENRSLYHSLCHSVISFLQAGMTFHQSDIDATIESVRRTTTMAKKFEPYKSWIPFNLSGKAALNEYELHAKLVYAEALLTRALVTFFQDQGSERIQKNPIQFFFVKLGLFRKLAKQNDRSRFASDYSYEHFDSGVRMGVGTFNLMISNLPQRIIKYLEFAGFTGDRELGLRELEKSARSTGIRSSFAAMFLLSYHTFVSHIFGNSDGDLETCQIIVERFLQNYPNSYMFLFFRARLQVLHCQLNQAIQTYEYAMQCQTDWKDLHHIAHWELLFCFALDNDWQRAIQMAELLLNENNWSKATYCYLLAVFLFEKNHQTATDESLKLFKRVPELKIRLAGRSNPLEKYAIRQSEHFLAQQWLFLPALEFLYLFNGFYILAHDTNRLQSTLDIVDQAMNDLQKDHRNDQFYSDSYGSGLLLRGVLLHFLHRYDHAHQCFDEIIFMHMLKQFDTKSFLAANAQLEKGLIYLTCHDRDKAMEYLQKSLNNYKEYQLESRLQFRINAAMQTAKRMTASNALL